MEYGTKCLPIAGAGLTLFIGGWALLIIAAVVVVLAALLYNYLKRRKRSR